ncbi:MAG: AMP-binding protein [Deltaproteobacteria bacterium]|nr:AMP-binding protein [Deltaproteobacteria bacterium]
MQIEPSDLFLERVLRWEKETPDRVYFTQPMGGGNVREYTWAEAVGEARRMAAHLASFGFPKGSRIAILSKNCAHFILSDLAIWMAGHVSVALYPTLSADTVSYILEHSESKLIFVGKLDEWENMKPGVPASMPRIAYSLSPKTDYPVWEDIVAKTEPLAGQPTRDADDTAILVYTSGSTGRPKAVEHTFRTMAAAARGFEEVLGPNPEERVLSYLPLAHAFERAVIEAMSFRTACHIYFAESLDTFVHDLQRARPTLFHSVPRLWLKFQQGVFRKMPEKKLKRLLKIPIVSGIVKRKILTGLGLDGVRIAASGSAPIPPELIQWYRDLGLELLEGYGMSENFSYSHVSVPGKTRVGYVGNANPSVEVKLSEEGEVLVKSPATMKSYYKEPELTAEAFTEDGFLRTGDRGELDEQGRLKITGRVKELFKTSKGKYIAPVPIENHINASSLIEQSCVMGSGQPQPFALIMLNEDLRGKVATASVRAEIDAALARLREEVNAKVPAWEQLELFAVVKEPWLIENGFLTPTLKIKRAVIEKRYTPLADGWYAGKKPVVWE